MTKTPEQNGFWGEAIAGLLIGVLGFAWLLSMLQMGPGPLPWMILRATGIAAYLALALSVVLGALLTSGYALAWLLRAAQYGWHGLLAGFGLAASTAHGLFLLVDSMYPQSLSQILIPGTTSFKPLEVGLGTVAFYAMLITYFSFAWRAKMPQKLWRSLHFLSYPAFILATLHGSWVGSDPLRVLYLASIGAVVFSFGLRLTRPKVAKQTQ